MDDYTENERFNINMRHLIPAIIAANEKLYTLGICETHPIVTEVALRVISDSITMENLIDNHKYWDAIISGDSKIILKAIQYYERRYPIKLSLFREIFFTDNNDFARMREQLYQNLKSLISISSMFISKMRNPIIGDDIIIYTRDYREDIDLEKYL